MTTPARINYDSACPVQNGVFACPTEDVLKLLTSKWTLRVLFLLNVKGKMRFSEFLKVIYGTNKQTLSIALRDLTEQGYLIKTTIKLKPLHIDYCLSEKGMKLIPLLKQFEVFNDN